MMELVLISLVAAVGAALSLFSGFGLGTVLMPVLALFFPVQDAIGFAALVHLATSLFKVGLVGRLAQKKIVLGFGLPALAGAFAGALLLVRLQDFPALAEYQLGMIHATVHPVKLAVGLVIAFFALWELRAADAQKPSFPEKMLAAGGLASGFFGGLSGHQGALRSAFLIRYHLSRDIFIGTNAVIAAMVDLTRLSVYGTDWFGKTLDAYGAKAAVVVAAALLGVLAANHFREQISWMQVQRLVAGLLFMTALALAAGWI